MRYIGNKTKLLRFIGSVADELGIRPGRAADIFAGTASVAQYLKRRGFAVESCDIMAYSYAFQRAYVEVDAMPGFERIHVADPDFMAVARRPDFLASVESRFAAQDDLFDESRPGGGQGSGGRDALRRVITYLDTYLDDLTSFVSREYAGCPENGGEGRMYFTASNARRIDAIRTRVHEWRRNELLTEDEAAVLIACLLEAADAVANTTGVYAAFVKSWQSNAVKPLRLREPALATGTGLHCRAHQADANRFVRSLAPVDLAYLDPPYNTRQYSAYYHVPEIIAEGWFEQEPALRGKTGLIPDDHKKSRWSVRRDCVDAFRDLIGHLDAKHVLLSYNNEGIIPLDAVDAVFAEFGRPGTFRRHEIEYARYRADSDRADRVYKADRVTEYVFSFELLAGGDG